MPATHILYVGTENGLAIYQAAAPRGAWQRQGHVLAGMAVQALVALDAMTLLVAQASGPAQQSFDGGISWSDAPGAPPALVGLQVMTVHGPAQLAYPRLWGASAYARLSGQPAALLGAGADGSLLFRSEDDGIHWSPADMGGNSFGRINTIIPAADQRDAAWAGAASGALLRSADRGQSWRLIAQEPAAILCLAAVAA